ncbi:MAG: HNH endonuclease [Solirubrobacteraceae bacterium]
MSVNTNMLILAPAAGKSGSVNFKHSVIDGVALEEIAGLPAEAKDAAAAHVVNGAVHMWGSRANKNRVWERVRRGDRVLFYTGRRFAAIARVAGKRRDALLADAVWPADPDSWQNIMFLRDVRPVSLPVSTVGALLGYERTWRGPQEFYIPAPEAQAHALNSYVDLDQLIASLAADSMLGNDAEEGESYADVVGRLASDSDVKELLDRLKTRSNGMIPSAKKEIVKRIKRDVRLVKQLKDLYDGHCQVCDDTFVTISGENYCEGAHIVPLAARLPGIDSYLNVVILCATCHKKLDRGGMRIFWDSRRELALYEWQGRRRRLRNNKHIHTGWQPSI